MKPRPPPMPTIILHLRICHLDTIYSSTVRPSTSDRLDISIEKSVVGLLAFHDYRLEQLEELLAFLLPFAAEFTQLLVQTRADVLDTANKALRVEV